ncbi:MAG: Mut7-C RNAse domain-containing protein [Candidatus Theseobacter exili]|nr:Mut7-C RNAse domain-containing protein [Candidatus Theseobacter exili]
MSCNSTQRKRIVLTRDTSLSDRESITDCFVVTDDLLGKQLVGVFNFFNLDISIDEIFSRCLICNKILVRVEKENIQEKVPSFVFETQDCYSACSCCGRVYWKGTHFINSFERFRSLGMVQYTEFINGN